MRLLKLYEEFKDQDFAALEQEVEELKYIIEDEGNMLVIHDRRSESDRTGKIITINIVHGLQAIPQDANPNVPLDNGDFNDENGQWDEGGNDDGGEQWEEGDDEEGGDGGHIPGGIQNPIINMPDGHVINLNLLNQNNPRDIEDEMNNLARGQNNQRMNARAHHMNANPLANLVGNQQRLHDPVLTADELYELNRSPFYNEFCSRLLDACHARGYTLVKKFFSSPDILIITDMPRRDYQKRYNHVSRAWYMINNDVELAPFQWNQ